MKNLVIIGAGGLAREVHDLAMVCFPDTLRIKGFLSKEDTGIADLGYPPIIGTIENYVPEANDVFICGIGSPHLKQKTTQYLSDKWNAQFINLIHPTCTLSPSVKLGVGVVIKQFSVISSDVSIENHCYLQSSVILGHDVHIEACCQLNSFVFIAGNSQIGYGSSINAGARIIQQTKIGANATVGIGSVVIKEVPADTTVFGNPARVVYSK